MTASKVRRGFDNSRARRNSDNLFSSLTYVPVADLGLDNICRRPQLLFVCGIAASNIHVKTMHKKNQLYQCLLKNFDVLMGIDCKLVVMQEPSCNAVVPFQCSFTPSLGLKASSCIFLQRCLVSAADKVVDSLFLGGEVGLQVRSTVAFATATGASIYAIVSLYPKINSQ